MALTDSDLRAALRSLDLPAVPVIAHASLSAFGQIEGEAETLLGAVLASAPALIMPAFTYHTLVIPAAGPPNNGLVYGSGRDLNRMARPFSPEMPADRLMGVLAETLRRHPQAERSNHPVLSFSGVAAQPILARQTLAEPLGPILALAEQEGWVLLLGVDHTVNTSIHAGERLAGRRQFVRWALTPAMIRECPGFPGCSNGFQAIEPSLAGIQREVTVGSGRIRAVPLRPLLAVVRELLGADPLALLCDQPDCLRCQAVRIGVEDQR